MQKITPFLWFDGQAEEAMNFYVSVFKNTKIGTIRRYGSAGPGPAGSVMSASFEIEGQQFHLLNGGPMYKLTPAISFLVDCRSQEEVDNLWNKLTADGGKPSRCGWLTDKFGVSWQIIPRQLGQLMSDPNPKKSAAVMQAMMGMAKIVIADLEKAHAGA